jgi:hypothetical protein
MGFAIVLMALPTNLKSITATKCGPNWLPGNGDFRKFIAAPRIQNRLALKTRLHGSNVGGETSLSGVILLEMIAT